MTFLSQFASEAAAADKDLFSALGIDWRLLILQIIAFLILVVLLGKFVYPWLMKSVDERQAGIEAAAIINYIQMNGIIHSIYHDANIAGSRMFYAVLHSFLHNAEENYLPVGIQLDLA